MTGTTRRAQILDSLRNSTVPISGSALARQFSVSRQIIVQDIAIIRAAGYDILSTTKGYLLKQQTVHTRVLKFTHNEEQMHDAMTTIVDLGGWILDLFIYHEIYGKLNAELSIRSRRDIKQFIAQYESDSDGIITTLTSVDHYHTIGADSVATLDLIEQTLRTNHLIL